MLLIFLKIGRKFKEVSESLFKKHVVQIIQEAFLKLLLMEQPKFVYFKKLLKKDFKIKQIVLKDFWLC